MNTIDTIDPVDPGFTRWLSLLRQTFEDSPEGDLARDVWEDPDWPADARTLDELQTYLESRHAAHGAVEALDRAYTRYLYQRWQQR